MTTTTVCKQFKFSAAHHLPDYPGECSKNHGHTFTVEIYARGPVGKWGMVVDFGDLKRAWLTVEGQLDHAELNDVSAMPSTENIAEYILNSLTLILPEVFKVRLWEGPAQFAEVER